MIIVQNHRNMWKLCILGCLFILINNFGHVDGRSQRIGRRIQRTGRLKYLVEEVTKVGYFIEEHFVTTVDGYVLSVHRIFGGPKSPPAPKKPLVLLTHGMGASSDIWILRGPGIDLVYLLVDEGYDAWMLNVRGSVYSRRSIRISPNRPEFWQFSWHETGIYDLPTTIDYMLDKTGLSKVSLIGHSMGSTVSLVLLSSRPEYNKKIDLAIHLAPTAIFTRQFRGPLSLIVKLDGVINLFRRNKVYEVLSYDSFTTRLIWEFCYRKGFMDICREISAVAILNRNPMNIDNALFSKVLSLFPAGTSLDTLDHYRQNIINASFREFNFGVNENYIRYGSPIPPEYQLSRITAPNVFYYGLNDDYVRRADVEALRDKIPNVVKIKAIDDTSFNHLDFIIGRRVKELLYDDVIDDLKNYSSKGY